MPTISNKNMPLSAAGADLGLGDAPADDEETEEQRKRRLGMIANRAAMLGYAAPDLLGNAPTAGGGMVTKGGMGG